MSVNPTNVDDTATERSRSHATANDNSRPSEPNDGAIVLSSVTKRFGDKTVLDDVSFSIPRGKTTVLLGPSGTGKSTLIRMAVGLQRPDAGRVVVLGQDVTSIGRTDLLALRRRMGMLFQDGALFGSLTVDANIAFPLKHVMKLSDDAIGPRVASLLELVGLAGFGGRTPDRLSGGQRKRVALARAIALEPEIVFFDEPTSGLDPQTSASIDALINDMQARLGLTFVVITHDTESAHQIADMVGMLHEGKLRAYGTRDEIWNSDDAVVRAFLDRVPLAGM